MGASSPPPTHPSAADGVIRLKVAVEPAPLPAGAAVVETLWYRLTHRLLREIMAHRGCLEVQGPGGCGKTYAVDSFFAAVGADVLKVHLESRPKGYLFLRRLVDGLGGRGAGDAQALMEELRSVVGDRRIYLYVDEADLLSRDALRQIRYLRDQRDLHLAFVLVGSNFHEAFKLVPELWSRVTRRVTFEPLEGDALERALAAYHPIFADADPALLRRIDEEHCRGVFRAWEHTLATLLDYAARRGDTGLNPGLVAAALGVLVDPTRSRSRPRPGRRPRAVVGTRG